jgi:hypothetical protein
VNTKEQIFINDLIENILESAKDSMNFSNEELRYLEHELRDKTYEELMDDYLPTWHEEQFKRTPVPVREWIYSPDYMDLKGQLFEVLVDDLEELFEGGYTEAVIDGAIGWGKSYFTSVALMRMVYEVSCLRNPQIAYGLARDTPISFVNAAIKEKTAKEVVFKYCKGLVKNSPYFQEEYQLEKELEAELVFQDNIRLWAATSSQSGIIGQNMFGGALDEINFFGKVINSSKVQQAGEVYDHAKTLWEASTRRMESRFKRQGSVPGILLMVSSNMYPDDFTIWRRELAEETGQKIFHRRYSQWETKPADWFSAKKFKVSLGNINVRPRIIRPAFDERHEPALDDEEALLAEGVKIVEVPEDFKNTFEQDIDMAIRDVAGYPTLTAAPFFRDVEPIRRAIKRGALVNLLHPYSRQTTTLEDGSHWLKDNLDYSKKSYRHFAHVDLALNGDAAGLTVVRLDGMVRRISDNLEGDLHQTIVLNKDSVEWVPHLTQVLSLRIVNTPGKDIQFAKVRRILIDLLNDGFFFSKITYDQYNSGDSIQYFQNIGIDSKKLSVDRKMDPYQVLKNLLQDDLLDMYDMPVLTEELTRLEIDSIKRKIEHPPKGSKDVSDTLAGAAFNAVTFALENPSLVTYGESEDAAGNLLHSTYNDDDDDFFSYTDMDVLWEFQSG